jgi:hypothetical protein
MHAHDYLQQANNTLKQAIQACQADIDNLRNISNKRGQELHDHLNELKRRESQRLTEAAETDSDRQTASHMQEARMLRNEEGQIEQDYKKQKVEIDNRITNMQRTINELNQITNQIDRQIGQLNPPTVLF